MNVDRTRSHRNRYILPGGELSTTDRNGMSLKEWGLDGVIISTPGHSHGCISIVFDDGDAIVGDAFSANGNGTEGMMPFFHAPDAAFEDCQDSVRKILDRGAKTVYSGHGGPYTREYVQQKLDEEIASMK